MVLHYLQKQIARRGVSGLPWIFYIHAIATNSSQEPHMNRIHHTDFARIRAEARSHQREYEADYWQTLGEALLKALHSGTACFGLPLTRP